MGTLWTEVGLLEDDRSLAPDVNKARSVIARYIAGRTTTSRSDIVKVTGLARSTVDQHLRVLLDSGLIEDAGLGTPDSRGRPAQVFRIAPSKGVLLIADISSRVTRLGITTLDRAVVARRDFDIDVAVGPVAVLEQVCAHFDAMLAENDLDRSKSLAMSIGLPGPVDLHQGFAVRPSQMPGWDGFGVCKYMAERFGCDIVVDNDVNLKALGEARALKANEGLPLLVVNIGTGIGGGLVSEDGLLLHGADGAATELGHARVPERADVICRCGGNGCLDAVASVGAMAERLSEVRHTSISVGQLFESLARGDGDAVNVVRECALLVGQVVADLVNFYNPARVVLSGSVTEYTDDFLAQTRSVVYQQAQPLATRNLSIVRGQLGAEAGLIGGMVNAIEQVLSPRGIQFHTRGPQSKMRPLGLDAVAVA